MNVLCFCLQVTTQAMVPFLPVYGWVGIWSCLFLLVLAAMEASTEVRMCYSFKSTLENILLIYVCIVISYHEGTENIEHVFVLPCMCPASQVLDSICRRDFYNIHFVRVHVWSLQGMWLPVFIDLSQFLLVYYFFWEIVSCACYYEDSQLIVYRELHIFINLQAHIL